MLSLKRAPLCSQCLAHFRMKLVCFSLNNEKFEILGKKTWIASWGARKIFMHAENNAKRWCSSTRHNPRSVGLTSVPLSLSSFLQEYYFRLRCLVVKVVLPATQQCYTQWYGSIHLTWRAKQQVYVFLWIAYRKISSLVIRVLIHLAALLALESVQTW